MKTSIPARAFLLLIAIAILSTASPAPAQDAPAQDAPTLAASTGFSFPIKGGKVQESIDRGIYTYMEIVAGSSHFWLVVPICGVKVGDTIEVQAGKYYPAIQNEELDITFNNFVVPNEISINGKAFPAFAAHAMPRGCIVSRPAK